MSGAPGTRKPAVEATMEHVLGNPPHTVRTGSAGHNHVDLTQTQPVRPTYFTALP
jgi:hypothetical protein